MTAWAGIRVKAELDRLGRLRFAFVATLAWLSLLWLVGGMVTSWAWHPPGFVNESGANIGRDFVALWTAAHLAIGGHPAAPYDQELLRAAEQTTIGAPVSLTTWFYPPFFLMLVLPLALLPYLAAAAFWIAAQFLAFGRLLHRIAPHPLTWLAALIFPGTAQCMISGQNGAISAGLIAGGLLSLERRPALAGVCWGFLSYKPHIAAAAFAALAFGRHWRTLAVALAVAAGLALASVVVLGIEPWAAFAHSADDAGVMLQTKEILWPRMVTAFAFARLAGLGVSASFLVQAVVAILALVVLANVWWRRAPLWLAGSVLVLSIPLTTPYAFYYDLVMVLLPLAWLLQEAGTTGFRRGEAILLAAAWVAPVVGNFIAEATSVQPTWLVLLLLLLSTWRRATAPSARS